MSGCEGGSCSTCGSNDDPDRLPPGMLRRYDLNQSTADGVLVWVEMGEDGPLEVSEEILSFASAADVGRVFAVIFGDAGMKQHYPRIFGFGANTIYHVRGDGSERYDPEVVVSSLAGIAERVVPASILIGATDRGREVAPRLASALETGLTADCTSLSFEDRKMVMTRPAFGGNLMADIECSKFPQMATVRPGALPRNEPVQRSGTAIYWQYEGGPIKEILSEEAAPVEGPDIRNAKMLISLGGGIRDRETVKLAFKVASQYGAEVSCSRVLVERGLLPHSRQVGMSGRCVSPDLYIAMGISGSVQHMAGIKDAKRIIAVNTDQDAPIHNFADLSLICDAKSVLESMLKHRISASPIPQRYPGPSAHAPRPSRCARRPRYYRPCPR